VFKEGIEPFHHYLAAQIIVDLEIEDPTTQEILQKLGWSLCPKDQEVIGTRHIEIEEDGTTWVHLQDVLENAFEFDTIGLLPLPEISTRKLPFDPFNEEELWSDYKWGHWVAYLPYEVLEWNPKDLSYDEEDDIHFTE